MGKNSPGSAASDVLSTGRIAAVRLLLALALAVDAYLAWVSLTGSPVAGCGPESNCHTVLSSRWAYWLGMPVSLPALVVYGLFMCATFGLSSVLPPARRRLAWKVLISCAVLVLGAGLWFVSIQMIILGAICPFCITAHGAAALASILILTQVPIAFGAGSKRGTREIGFNLREITTLCLEAVALLIVLFGGQLLWQPKAYLTQMVASGIRTNVPATAAAARTAREFQLFNGQFVLKLEEVPLIGRPSAPHTMLSLFDYTCHHCREMHPHLLAAYQQFSNELAIINLPMPLDGKCNPIIRTTLPPHTNACAMARLGLTVWEADRLASVKFDEWIFAAKQPPLPAEAERYARQLVGDEAFDRARTNAWVEQQIRQDIAIYEAIYRQFRKGYMPEIIIGTNLISGAFSRAHLFEVLGEQFNLKAPEP